MFLPSNSYIPVASIICKGFKRGTTSLSSIMSMLHGLYKPPQTNILSSFKTVVECEDLYNIGLFDFYPSKSIHYPSLKILKSFNDL